MEFTTKELFDTMLHCVEDALMDNLDSKSNVKSVLWNAKLVAAQNWLWDQQDESENI